MRLRQPWRMLAVYIAMQHQTMNDMSIASTTRRRMPTAWWAGLWLAFLVLQPVVAQEALRFGTRNGPLGFGTHAYTGPEDGRWAADSSATDEASVAFLVEFVETPYYVARAEEPVGVAVAAYEQRFGEFTADLAALAGAQAGRSAAGVDVAQTFYRIFFGARVQVPRAQAAAMAAAMAAWPYVKHVHPDAAVTALLDRSVAWIGADAVWQQYGTRGEGVTVGIIDSGVDYLHPALGGGIGPGYKVAGGYDFVDGDDDPMDDLGHGTHVAGIVAADGAGFRGVAPGARLVAYRVLNARGEGTSSQVIAALERAVDPNLDGDLSDRLDVVNISLGSRYGRETDPTSVAVDHATRLGVICVVAAGNTGGSIGGRDDNYYYNGSETIGSPAAARLAVTVGSASVDPADRLAPSSSKGPVGGTFAIKPDVLAPGVDIRSLAPGGGEVRLSGTSMAAPHVAGVAALLKALHPEWTPGQLKSALVNTAHDAGYRVMQQGAGRLDARRAAATQTLAVPAHLSFGLDDPLQATWAPRETVWIYNRGEAPQDYDVSAEGLRSGITLMAAPERFAIAPGDSQQVVFSLAVSNGTIPLVADDLPIYQGIVRIVGTRDVLRVPWAFVRASRLTLTVSDPEVWFMGESRDGYYFDGQTRGANKVYWITPRRADVVGLPGGTYDLAAFFGRVDTPLRLVVREDVVVPAAGGVIHLDAAEAVHPVHFDGVDETGRPLRDYERAWQGLLVELPSGEWLTGYSQYRASPGMYVSPLSARYTLHGFQGVSAYGPLGRVYVPHFTARPGGSGPVRFTNDPAQYVRQTVRFQVPPGVSRLKVAAPLTFYSRYDGGEATSYATRGGASYVDVVDVTDGYSSAEVFLAPPVDARFVTGAAFLVNYTDLGKLVDVETPDLVVQDGSVVAGLPHQVTRSHYRAPAGGTLTFNAAPPFIFNVSYNNTGQIQFVADFWGPLRERHYRGGHTGSYAVYDGAGRLLRSAPLAEVRAPLAVEPGAYRLEVTSPHHYVRRKQSQVTYIERFDLRRPVPFAPRLTAMQLRDGAGMLRDAFAPDEAARLLFAAKSYAEPPELPVAGATRAYYRIHGTEAWTALPVRALHDDVQREGAAFEADLAAATAAGRAGVDLRLVVRDAYGNEAELLQVPAFAVGDWTGLPDVGDGPEEPGVPTAVVLHPGYPNPFNPSTMLAFDLPQPGRATLEVFDVTGRRVAVLFDEERPAGRHTVVWDAAGCASGVYISRLTAAGQVRTRRLVRLR